VRALDTTGVAVVDVLQAGVDPQHGRLEQAGESAVVPIEDLVIDDQSQAFLAGEFLGGGLR
jgi:hypothetical protein